MRDELSALLTDIAGRLPDPGLGMLEEPVAAIRPPLKDRAPMWDLAIKLMRELGSEVDLARDAPDAVPAPPTRRRRIDFGGA